MARRSVWGRRSRLNTNAISSTCFLPFLLIASDSFTLLVLSSYQTLDTVSRMVYNHLFIFFTKEPVVACHWLDGGITHG